VWCLFDVLAKQIYRHIAPYATTLVIPCLHYVLAFVVDNN